MRVRVFVQGAQVFMELFMLGYAIDTNVRDIPTVVYDQAGTQESRALLQKFENSQTLKIVGLLSLFELFDDETQAIQSFQ